MLFKVKFVLLFGIIQLTFGFRPGIMRLKLFTNELSEVTNSKSVKMDFIIFDARKTVLTQAKKVEMIFDGAKEYYHEISFDIDDVNQKLLVSVTVHFNSIDKLYFEEMPFHADENAVDLNQEYIPFGPFFSTKTLISFFINLKISCKKNYYPPNKCTKMCVEFHSNEICDNQGMKKCKDKYIIDRELDQCVTNWCVITTEKCKNNAPCVNDKNGIKCSCPIHYFGKLCDEYKDPCQTYQCGEDSTCLVKDYKVKCISNKADNPLKISSFTIAIGLGALCLVLLIVCIVACTVIFSRQKNRKRSACIQNHQFNRQMQVLHDNSSLEHYKNHLMFNQIPSEQNSLKNWSMTPPPMNNYQRSSPQSNEYLFSCAPNQNAIETVNLLQSRFNEQMPERLKTYVLPAAVPLDSMNSQNQLIRSQSAQNISIDQDAMNNSASNNNYTQNKPITSYDSLRYKTPNYTTTLSRNMRNIFPNSPSVRFNNDVLAGPSLPQVPSNLENPSIASNQDLPEPPTSTILRQNSNKLFTTSPMNGSLFI